MDKAEGGVFTVTVRGAVIEQPLVLLTPVRVYAVVAVGLKVTVVPVGLDMPVVGVQL
jgi:hypothetical protein